MAILHIKPRGEDAFDHPLGTGTTSVGRVNANTVVIRGDTAISRQHCQFDFTESGLFVSDLGSSNGTHVNGERIRDRVPLRDGDRVRVGGAVITVEDPATGEASVAQEEQVCVDADGTVYTPEEITCGVCSAPIEVGRLKAGHRVGCARCRSTYVVPEWEE
jgi:predicted component of type VI protein secretion system